MKTKKLIFLLLISIITNLANAQSFIGYDTDNYNGITGVTVNPANIADARVQIDFNLLSTSTMIANDYVGLSLSNVQQLIDGGDFTGLNTFASNQNSVLANVEVLGPSFMFNLNEKHSVGLLSRVRFINNYNNINGNLLEGVVDGFPTEDFSFNQNNLDGTTHIWGEIGLSYGRVLYYDYDKHYLKAGVTLKYLLGMGVAQGKSRSLSGNYSAGNDEVSLNGDFSYVISYDEEQEFSDYLKNLSPGYGMDIGFVYEYRTRESRRADADDNPRALNKYRAKIGVSLLDFGQINYKDLEQTEYTVNGTVSADDAEADFVDALENNFTEITTVGDVKVALPTSLKVNIDYKVVPKIYVNLDINQTLVKKDSPFNNNRLNLMTLTPRLETRFFSAYLPFSYSQLGKTAIGAGIKLGPLIIGSGSIISNLISDDVQMANVYLASKISIKHKK
jgi:hypothetical protein